MIIPNIAIIEITNTIPAFNPAAGNFWFAVVSSFGLLSWGLLSCGLLSCGLFSSGLLSSGLFCVCFILSLYISTFPSVSNNIAFVITSSDKSPFVTTSFTYRYNFSAFETSV